MRQPIYNGRVNIAEPSQETRFSLFDRIPSKACDTYHDALVGTFESSELSDRYFSASNIRHIQSSIIEGVYRRSGGKYSVGEQDCDVLKTIMRGVFLESSRNLPCDINEQIEQLNQIVLQYAIPQVMGAVEGYLKYRKDVSTLAMPLPNPVSSDYKTTTLEWKRWF